MRLAIITGGSGYVGGAITARLRGSGWRVIALSRSAEGDDAIACDTTVWEDVQKAVETITAEHGSISACIHAATAPIDQKGLLDLDPEAFDAHIRVAARGAYLLAKAAAPHMEKEAAFIGITSKLIEPGMSTQLSGAYIAGKYALRGVLRSLTAELGKRGVRVYAVAPGYLPGGLNRGIPDKVLDFLAKKSGTGVDSIDDVTALVEQLCNDKEIYPTGSSITFSPINHSLL